MLFALTERFWLEQSYYTAQLEKSYFQPCIMSVTQRYYESKTRKLVLGRSFSVSVCVCEQCIPLLCEWIGDMERWGRVYIQQNQTTTTPETRAPLKSVVTEEKSGGKKWKWGELNLNLDRTQWEVTGKYGKTGRCGQPRNQQVSKSVSHKVSQPTSQSEHTLYRSDCWEGHGSRLLGKFLCTINTYKQASLYQTSSKTSHSLLLNRQMDTIS